MDLEKAILALTEDVKALARARNISESELVLKECRDFMQTHGEHGLYDLDFVYDEKGLHSIDLKCNAMYGSVCAQSPIFIIYQRADDGKSDSRSQIIRKNSGQLSRHQER